MATWKPIEIHSDRGEKEEERRRKKRILLLLLFKAWESAQQETERERERTVAKGVDLTLSKY